MLLTRPLLTWPLLLRDLLKSAQCCFLKSSRRSVQSWSGLRNWCLPLWSQSPRNKSAWYRKQDDFRRTTWCSSLPASSASRSRSCKTALQMFEEGSRVNAFWFAMAPESVRVDGWSAALLAWKVRAVSRFGRVWSTLCVHGLVLESFDATLQHCALSFEKRRQRKIPLLLFMSHQDLAVSASSALLSPPLCPTFVSNLRVMPTGDTNRWLQAAPGWSVLKSFSVTVSQVWFL